MPLTAMIIFGLILMMAVVSAFEFDNIKDYDGATKTVTIHNSVLGIKTTQIATAKLITPQVYYVMAGTNRKVAEFEIDLSEDSYTNALKEIEFTNNLNRAKITRTFTYEYKTIESYEVDVNDYKEECSEAENKTQVCVNKIIGTHKETRTRETWTPLGKLDLVKGKITIGIFTDVYANDNVEWVPTLFGVKINEWATWTASMNIGLTHYWNFSETAGTNAKDYGGSRIGNTQYNFTMINGAGFNSGGVVGYCASFDGVDDLANFTGMNGIGINDWTLSYWAKPTVVRDSNALVGGEAYPSAGKETYIDLRGGCWKHYF
jgi:hypothetical protein